MVLPILLERGLFLSWLFWPLLGCLHILWQCWPNCVPHPLLNIWTCVTSIHVNTHPYPLNCSSLKFDPHKGACFLGSYPYLLFRTLTEPCLWSIHAFWNPPFWLVISIPTCSWIILKQTRLCCLWLKWTRTINIRDVEMFVDRVASVTTCVKCIPPCCFLDAPPPPPTLGNSDHSGLSVHLMQSAPPQQQYHDDTLHGTTSFPGLFHLQFMISCSRT